MKTVSITDDRVYDRLLKRKLKMSERAGKSKTFTDVIDSMLALTEAEEKLMQNE